MMKNCFLCRFVARLFIALNEIEKKISVMHLSRASKEDKRDNVAIIGQSRTKSLYDLGRRI